MRVRIASGGLWAVTIFAFTPAAVAGQTIPSPFRYIETRQEVGVFAGQTSAAKGRFGFGPGGGLRAGVRWGIDLSGPLGFEAVAGVIRGKRDIVDPNRAEGDRKIGEEDSMLGTIDARLRFTFTGERTWHGLAPYIVAGGGMAFNLSNPGPLDEQLDQDNRFSFGSSFLGTVGGGSRLYLTDRLALRGDAVFSLWKLDTPPGFSDPDLEIPSVEKSEWVSALHLTLAAVIRF